MSFGFKSVGHFFASAAHDLKVVGSFLTEHQTQIDTTLDVGTAIASKIDPALAPLATIIDKAAEAALGEILATVSTASDAAAANGLNVSLDAATVADFKGLIAQMEAAKPGSTVVPSGLATTAKAA